MVVTVSGGLSAMTSSSKRVLVGDAPHPISVELNSKRRKVHIERSGQTDLDRRRDHVVLTTLTGPSHRPRPRLDDMGSADLSTDGAAPRVGDDD